MVGAAGPSPATFHKCAPLAMGSEQPSRVGGWVTFRVLFLLCGKPLYLLLIPAWIVLTMHGPLYPTMAKLGVVLSPPLFILSGITLTAKLRGGTELITLLKSDGSGAYDDKRKRWRSAKKQGHRHRHTRGIDSVRTNRKYHLTVS